MKGGDEKWHTVIQKAASTAVVETGLHEIQPDLQGHKPIAHTEHRGRHQVENRVKSLS